MSKKNSKIDILCLTGIVLLYLFTVVMILYKKPVLPKDVIMNAMLFFFYSFSLSVIFHAYFIEGVITITPKRAFFVELKRNNFKKLRDKKYTYFCYIILLPALFVFGAMFLYYCYFYFLRK